MKKIQIKNVRSLKDTGVVPLSPITLLVGENSSGKSTFLRTFPLIKQSILQRTDGPLLWAGDADDYVDFGSFSETVTNGGANSITFNFIFQSQCFRASRFFLPFTRYAEWDERLNKDDSVCYSITISQRDGHEYISKLVVRLNRILYNFTLEPEPSCGRIVVDHRLILDSTKNTFRKKPEFSEIIPVLRKSIFGFVLPSITEMSIELSELFGEFPAQNLIDTVENDEYIRHHFFSRTPTLLQYIGTLLCKGVLWEEIRDIVLKEISKGTKPEVWEPFPQLLGIIYVLSNMEPKKRESCLTKCKLLAFYDVFERLDDYLADYFRQVHYIAPLRATAERYYRLRNLAIDEVDYQGKNLPIFLSGLSQSRLAKFQSLTQEFFGFRVIVERKAGHISVKVALQDGNAINLSDTGFGYSQILPIITQIWDLSTATRTRKRNSTPLVIAIEQPELHLHPALQAKLAEAFIACIRLAKRNDYQLQLLLETHSETIVNYFGRAIARGSFQKEDISIVLFNKDTETNNTTVKTTNYDDNGLLENWPIGFFSPER